MTLVEPDRLSEKTSDGLRRFLECVDEGYTGKLIYDFRNGEPQWVTKPDKLGRDSSREVDLTDRTNVGSR